MADRWQPVHYLSSEETQNASWGFWTGEPGYDETKHEPNERGEVIFPREVGAEPGSNVASHWEYEPLTTAEAEQVLAVQRGAEAVSEVRFRAAGAPLFDEQPQMSVPDWEIRRYLSYEESHSGYSSDPRGVPGYDPTKHDPSPMPFNQYIFPSADPSDGEQGHFEYHPLVEYPESEPEEPTVATVDTETVLELEIHAGEGLTYIYWEPLDWDSRFPTDEWGMSFTDADPSFMQVDDMEALWARPTQAVIGTKVNKIIMASGTDPARYEIDEWDPNLAKYRLILKRHDSMPVERVNQGLVDSSVDDMTITGAHFEEEGTLKVQISDQGWLFESTQFQIPPGGYRLLVTGWNRRLEDETVAIDMWPSDKADEPDEVLKPAEWY